MKSAPFFFLFLFLFGCSSTYYSVWEKLGKHKRDLLRDNVESAIEEQEETNREFKDALTQLRETYSVKDTELSQAYDRLSSSYERSESQAADLRSRIEKMNTIANDLFSEWRSEAESIETARLREQSLEKLETTKARYQRMYDALNQSHRKTTPVLRKFRDNVLYLKHNLNAQVIGSLSGQADEIAAEIEDLIQSMSESTRESERFLETLG